MDAVRGQPVHLLNAVMNCVEPPERGHRVEGAVSQVEANIGYDDHLRRLQPDRLGTDGGRNSIRHGQSDASHHAPDHEYLPDSYEDAVEEQIDKIVCPVSPKNLLSRMKGENPFQWHEDECNEQDQLEVNQVH